MKWNFSPLLNTCPVGWLVDRRCHRRRHRNRYELLQRMLITTIFPPKNRSLPSRGACWHQPQQQSWPPSGQLPPKRLESTPLGPYHIRLALIFRDTAVAGRENNEVKISIFHTVRVDFPPRLRSEISLNAHLEPAIGWHSDACESETNGKERYLQAVAQLVELALLVR